MKKISKIIIGFLLFGVIAGVLAAPNIEDQANWQHLVWKHIPLTINLPFNKEKIIHFPHSVSLGIPSDINGDLVVQNNAGWLYLMAKAEFAKTRVEVKDNETGDIILLNVATNNAADDINIDIVYQPEDSTKPKSANKLKGDLSYVMLTRYAYQQLYAPKRLQKNPYNIQLITSYAKDNNVDVKNWFSNLFMDNSTINIPWAEWHGGDYYITAVLIRNQLPKKINLNHKLPLICGRSNHLWQAVTFFPDWRLDKAGSLHDTAVAFLVSRKPFDEAVKICKGMS